MDPDRWRRAEELFHAALERPLGTRTEFLESSCSQDTELRRAVENLISKDDLAGSFLEMPLPVNDIPARESIVGQKLGPYEILSSLGSGGMGDVYRARDSKLGRDVAIKMLPAKFARNPERIARLRSEGQTLASLNHPNTSTIYGLEESCGTAFLVLELVEGEAIGGPLPIDVALDYAAQIADALEAAHEHGIVHRDLKPANIKVTPEKKIKVLDFGLATVVAGDDGGALLRPSDTQLLRETFNTKGNLLGTPGYMSPEQVQGTAVDQRSDIWAFGCVLYELLTGRRAFDGLTPVQRIVAVVETEPNWVALPKSTPPQVRTLLRHCLQKNPQRRPKDIRTVRMMIRAVQARRRRLEILIAVRRPRIAIPATVILLLLALLGAFRFRRSANERWVAEQAIPEITRLVENGDLRSAYRLLRRAEKLVPGHPGLHPMHEHGGLPASFTTNPPGAEVWATGYMPDDDEWVRLGTTPFTTKELWWGDYRLRITKPGYQTVLGTGEVKGGNTLEFDLDRDGTLPPDMVRVPGGLVTVSGLPSVAIRAFLIDRYEVTNRQYKHFVDAGGYRRREYWPREFNRDGNIVDWQQAMELLHDVSGLPGPSTWKNGTYPRGAGEYPVNGVSWFEAAAYARFAAKQLPTIYHWQQAAKPGYFSAITEVSNFAAGPARVGSHQGLGPFGTFDMVGNVREWCWNDFHGSRFARGGSWDDPSFAATEATGRSPWQRAPQNGFRCVRYDPNAERAARAPITTVARDYTIERPAADDVFRAYRRWYDYDPSALESHGEGIDQDNPIWRRERISFLAAYGDERVGGYLYVPKSATPPYQAVIYAHPGMSLRLPSLQLPEEHFFDFVVKSGRVLLVPVLKGHYQRRYSRPPAGPNEARDRLILESKDFRRSIDYLISRPDIDRDRIGVYSVSRGSSVLPLLAVGENRLKAAVIVATGFNTFGPDPLPEADPLHFLPRFTVPALVVNGRDDFVFPFETTARPWFLLLGTPHEQKRLTEWNAGHGDFRPAFQKVRTEALAWLDRYLGRIK